MELRFYSFIHSLNYMSFNFNLIIFSSRDKGTEVINRKERKSDLTFFFCVYNQIITIDNAELKKL